MRRVHPLGDWKEKFLRRLGNVSSDCTSLGRSSRLRGSPSRTPVRTIQAVRRFRRPDQPAQVLNKQFPVDRKCFSCNSLWTTTPLKPSGAAAWHLLVPFAGILVCMAWLSLVENYRNLNSVKFKVIHELENQLPASLYAYEWQLLEQGEGNVYKPVTRIEQRILYSFLARGTCARCRY